jgi:phosphohistidine phosphatase SixA
MNFQKNLNGQIILPVLFLYYLLGSFSSAASSFSIYLVRHAEQLTDAKNPALTICGQYRAKQLASLLSKVNFTSIYSPLYHHAMQTAKPLADHQQVVIKNYNSNYLEQLSLKLQHQKSNTFVVAQRNTIQRLVELLAKQTVEPLSEVDYRSLYQLQFVDQQVILTTFQQPLLCKNVSSQKQKNS